MLKALNISPSLLGNSPPTEPGATTPGIWAATREFIKRPDSCDLVITWAPTPWSWNGAATWKRTDEAVAYILSCGKKCIVCVPSSDFVPGGGCGTYAQRLAWVKLVMDRYPECGVAVSNEPTFAKVSHKESAQLMMDAAEYAGSRPRGHCARWLIGPCEADWLKQGGLGGLACTPHILWYLRKCTPPEGVTLDVGLHPYFDGQRGGAVVTRLVLAAMKLLLRGKWKPRLCLTEGFFTYSTHQLPNPDYPADPAYRAYTNLAADEATQAQRLWRHFTWCAKQARIYIWANYEVVDSLWSGWASGLFRYGAKIAHPVLATWLKLKGDS